MVFEFNPNKNVLLLGEGNFSFCKDLLAWMKAVKNVRSGSFCNVYASCFEETSRSNLPEDVRKHLENEGVNVLCGVDATNLRNQTALVSKKFHKIIFNFPHIGGKMRMDLNRALLRNFFVSAAPFLLDDGRVLVSLCEGQGGTPADKPRRYDDTWKVVECAAAGNFILVQTMPWPMDLLKDYSSSGFRGLQKSFRTKGAIVHVFKRVEPLDVRAMPEDLMGFHPVSSDSSVRVPLAFVRLLSKVNNLGPSDHIGVHSYVLARILDILPDDFKYLGPLPLTTEQKLADNQVCCLHNNCSAFLRSSLHQVTDLVVEPSWACGIVCYENHEDFSSYPGSYQMLLDGCYEIEKIIAELSRKLGVLEDNSWCQRVPGGSFQLNLDVLCVLLFKSSLPSAKCLWAKTIPVVSEADEGPRLTELSLYPPSYTFDLSFASDGPLSDEPFFTLMHNLADNLVESIVLQSRYSPEGSAAVYHCFRITYRSYEVPLTRSTVVAYQQNTVRFSCEKYLGVVVR